MSVRRTASVAVPMQNANDEARKIAKDVGYRHDIFHGAPETACGTMRMKAALEGQYDHQSGGGYQNDVSFSHCRTTQLRLNECV